MILLGYKNRSASDNMCLDPRSTETSQGRVEGRSDAIRRECNRPSGSYAVGHNPVVAKTSTSSLYIEKDIEIICPTLSVLFRPDGGFSNWTFFI